MKTNPPQELFENNTENFSIGLVLDPEDTISDLRLKYNLNSISCIQIMSVVPGFQGKPFIKEVLQKIEQLKSDNYRGEIFIDGGINEETLPLILEQKEHPDHLCVGSYLAKALKIN
jgi:pentose-5-phosphate-3-epimerase